MDAGWLLGYSKVMIGIMNNARGQPVGMRPKGNPAGRKCIGRIPLDKVLSVNRSRMEGIGITQLPSRTF